jgi:hypothetical protein
MCVCSGYGHRASHERIEGRVVPRTCAQLPIVINRMERFALVTFLHNLLRYSIETSCAARVHLSRIAAHSPCCTNSVTTRVFDVVVCPAEIPVPLGGVVAPVPPRVRVGGRAQLRAAAQVHPIVP